MTNESQHPHDTSADLLKAMCYRLIDMITRLMKEQLESYDSPSVR